MCKIIQGHSGTGCAAPADIVERALEQATAPPFLASREGELLCLPLVAEPDRDDRGLGGHQLVIQLRHALDEIALIVPQPLPVRALPWSPTLPHFASCKLAPPCRERARTDAAQVTE